MPTPVSHVTLPVFPLDALVAPAAHGKWWLLLAAFVAGSGLVVALALTVSYYQTLESGKQKTQTYGLVVAEETTRTFQAIDQRLEITALTFANLDAASTRNVALVNAMLGAQIKDLPFLRAMWLANASGKVQYDTDPLNTVSNDSLTGADVDYRALFAAQPQLDFYVGLPLRSGQRGAWLIHAARPLRSPSGTVVGVLVAAIDPLYFESLWGKIDLGSEGSIALLTRQGNMLIRSPFVDATMAKSFKDRPVFKTYLPANDNGNYVDVSSVDRIERMFTYRTLEAQPGLVVILGQSVRQVLEPWWRWVTLVGALWVAASAGLVATGYFLARTVRHKEATDQVLRTQQERYRTLYLNAMDAILITNPDGRVTSANPAACTLFGHTEAEIQALGRSGLIDVNDARLAKALAARAATGHFQGELTFVRSNGSHFEGEVTTTIAIDEHGETQGTVIIRDASERKRSEAALQRYADQLQTLSRRVIDTQEAERRRLANELHDELGQALTAIKINLQAGAKFKGRSADELNAENISIVEDALQQVRRLALALRPSILDNLGLVPALNWLGKQAASRSHLVFEFQSIVLAHRLAPELETTCFRVAQEAVTNIVRHAHAKHFSITMTQEGHTLAIVIRDDGVGMDWSKVRTAALAGTSFGVLGMQERAALVSGELQVYSTPGGGCTLVLRCPLPAPLEHK